MKIDHVWFEEFGTIDWEKLVIFQKEEEKRMKQIDFSKPLQTSGDQFSARVVQEGMTLVEYTGTCGEKMYVTVDETGKPYAMDNMGGRGFSFKVENKPEEPNDHIILYRTSPRADWSIAAPVFTKSDAEFRVRRWGKDAIAVKVPV